MYACESKLPPKEERARAEKLNSDGIGVAWYESKEKEIRWEKGLDLPGLEALLPEIPFPLILHFRTASIGISCDELTHPFPLTEKAELFTSGRTKGSVLFHNGTWRAWRDSLWQHFLGTGNKVPEGEWSDTRAIAYLASFGGGFAFLDLFFDGQKLALFSAPSGKETKPDIKLIGDFDYDKDLKLWRSNTSAQYAYQVADHSKESRGHVPMMISTKEGKVEETGSFKVYSLSELSSLVQDVKDEINRQIGS